MLWNLIKSKQFEQFALEKFHSPALKGSGFTDRYICRYRLIDRKGQHQKGTSPLSYKKLIIDFTYIRVFADLLFILFVWPGFAACLFVCWFSVCLTRKLFGLSQQLATTPAINAIVEAHRQDWKWDFEVLGLFSEIASWYEHYFHNIMKFKLFFRGSAKLKT